MLVVTQHSLRRSRFQILCGLWQCQHSYALCCIVAVSERSSSFHLQLERRHASFHCLCQRWPAVLLCIAYGVTLTNPARGVIHDLLVVSQHSLRRSRFLFLYRNMQGEHSYVLCCIVAVSERSSSFHLQLERRNASFHRL